MKLRPLLLSLALFSIMTMPALADGVYIPKVDTKATYAQDITEPEQKAVIIHFNGKERLILQVSYKGNVSEFVWLIPTPARPKVSVADAAIFHLLHVATAPRVKYWFGANEFGVHGVAAGTKFSGVDVLEQRRIGVYDVSVLRARNADDLLGWLDHHGYQVNTRTKTVLGDYIRRGWTFTAAKINVREQARSANGLAEGTLESLDFQFDSKQPVYPLKISSLNAGRTDILLYVISDHRVEVRPLKTVCVLANLNRWTKSDGGGLSPFVVRKLLPEDRDPSLGLRLTKVAGTLSPKDMIYDLVPQKAKSNDEVIPGVPAPFMESLGAAILAMMSLPFLLLALIPESMILLIPVIGIALIVFSSTRYGRKRQDICFITGFFILIGPFAVGFGVFFLSLVVEAVGFWPVSVVAFAAIAYVLLRLLLRKYRKPRKAVVQ